MEHVPSTTKHVGGGSVPIGGRGMGGLLGAW